VAEPSVVIVAVFACRLGVVAGATVAAWGSMALAADR